MTGSQFTTPGSSSPMKVMRLNRDEVRSLAGLSQLARTIYAVCTRPYADPKAVVAFSEDALMERLERCCDEGGLSLAMVKHELGVLVERGMISRTYSQQAYRVVAGLH